MRRIHVPDDVRSRIEACVDEALLDRWLIRASTVDLAEELDPVLSLPAQGRAAPHSTLASRPDIGPVDVGTRPHAPHLKRSPLIPAYHPSSSLNRAPTVEHPPIAALPLPLSSALHRPWSTKIRIESARSRFARPPSPSGRRASSSPCSRDRRSRPRSRCCHHQPCTP